MDLALGVVIEQRGGDLVAADVVDADEQDLGHVLAELALDLGERPQPLAREAVHQQRHEAVESRPGDASSDPDHVALDRLGREGSG